MPRPEGSDSFEAPGSGNRELVDLVVVPPVNLRGEVRAPYGTPVGNPWVTVFYWDEGGAQWLPAGPRRLGRRDGSFDVSAPAGQLVTVKVWRSGFDALYLGGSTTLPGAPTPNNSLTVEDDTELGRFVLTPLPFANPAGPVLGGSAGEHCLSQPLLRNDDGSTRRVALPFDLTFFGRSYSSAFVNNNGNITFGRRLSNFTPAAINGGPDDQNFGAVIAPFFADVDTRGLRSRIVTYGASEDGNSFCVNWADVGYYSYGTDRLNTFQLVITKASGTGVQEGDFDITFHYNKVDWEAGNASGGSGGLGGTSALAGFSAGTGEPGTFVQLDGSLENGALIDGGPKALVNRSQNSATPGRFIFRVRNSAEQAELGNMSGRVLEPDGTTGVAGAAVQACTTARLCPSTTTGPDGRFLFTGIPVGIYSVEVNPPTVDGPTLLPGRASAVVEVPGGVQDDVEIILEAPTVLQSGVVDLTSATPGTGTVRVNDDGVPVTDYRAALDLTVRGCSMVPDPTYTLTLNGVVKSTGALTEEPAGVYRARVAPTYPDHGAASITTNVPAACGRPVVAFDLYIDPSGVVADQYGRPLSGATVTLRRSDSEAGPFAAVPDGSALMSPSNRTNPDTTDGTGFFQWDVLTGWYKVAATKAGCSNAETRALEVPPVRLDLLIQLRCTQAAPTPTTAPVLSGTPAVGGTLSLSPGTWDHGIVRTATRWLRNGTQVATGSSYAVTAADAGTTITARAVAKKDDYVQPLDAGTVTFDEVTYDVTAAIPAPPGGGTGGGSTTLTSTKAPSITGAAKVGQTLKADPGTWNADGLTFAYAWSRGGTPIAGATGAEYVSIVDDLAKAITVTVTASKAGASGKASSAQVTVAKGDAPTATAAPAISGTARPGGTLTATDGTWSASGLSFTHQWLADGSPIAGATGTSYDVKPGDVGKELSVRVTATKAGYADGSAISETVTVTDVTPPPPPVTQAESTTTATLVRDVVKAGKRAKVRVQVALATGMRAMGRVVVRIDGKAMVEKALGSGADGRATVTLPKLASGEHTVRVRYLGNTRAKASSSEKLTLVVQPKRSKKPMPSMF